jgi:hypothetical protein
MINYTRRRTDDDDPFETVIGHDGKPARVLKDGRSVRVRFRDAEAVRAQPLHDGRQPLTDQQRRELRGCKPGYRVLVDSASQRQRRAQLDAAYAESEAAMCAAWKRPPLGLGRLVDNGRFGQQFEGDQCTINGEPGHLRRVGGTLRCVPDDEDDRDIDEIFDAAQGGVDPVEAARRSYIFDLTHAWKRG